jgi:hypothetical protein
MLRLQLAQVEPRRKAGRPTEHDIRLARIRTPAGIAQDGANEEVIYSIAVDVARSRDGVAGEVFGIRSQDQESAAAVAAVERKQRCQLELGSKRCVAAEYDVDLALRVIGVGAFGRGDQDVVVAVAVQVAAAPTRMPLSSLESILVMTKPWLPSPPFAASRSASGISGAKPAVAPNTI